MNQVNHKSRLPENCHFGVNEQNHLTYNGCDTVALAREYGTPLYVMNENGIREKCSLLKKEFMHKYPNTLVLYASKAFSTLEIYRILKDECLGVDVVSGGELFTAYKAGFPMDMVYFHGNNKSYDEMDMALSYGVGRFVVDSYYELEVLDALAKQHGVKAHILIRVSPGIEIHSHDYLKTGVLDCKFGFPIETGAAKDVCIKAASYENLNFVGIHCHIGSQIFSQKSFEDAIVAMLGLVNDLHKNHSIVCKELNMGGGYGIRYTDDTEFLPVGEVWASMVSILDTYCNTHALTRPKMIIEPGRWLVGDNGITLYTVGAEKDIPGVRKYVSVDGSMTDNPRPTLYQAEYQAICASHVDGPEEENVAIAGRCCESGDILIKGIAMPKLQPGDVLAVLSTGAYNYAMASNYNRLRKPAVIMVKNGEPRCVVKRETYEDVMKNDVL